MSKILILGGDGFIGSHLIDDLLIMGYEVADFSLYQNNSPVNLKHLDNKIDFFNGNFLDIATLDKALIGVDYVFHMISLSTPTSTMKDPLFDIDNNLRGTIGLLDLCVKHKIKKIIFPSSGGTIYGEKEKDFLSETDLTDPICPYGISKLTIEKYLGYFYQLYGLDYLIFRISNPYGERQNPLGKQGIIPIFLNLINSNQPINVFGDGNSIRDYIYVKDVTGFISKIFNQPTKYKLYNLGSGEGHDINSLIKIMKNVCDTDIKINYLDTRKNEVKKIILDTNRIKHEFAFHPKIDIISGIRKTFNYIRSIN